MTREWGRTSADDAKATYLRALKKNGGRKVDAARKADRTISAVSCWRKRDAEFTRSEQMVLDSVLVGREERDAKQKARYLRGLERGSSRAEAAINARRSYKAVMGWRETDGEFAAEEARVLQDLHGREDPDGTVPKPEVIRRLKAKLGCSNRWIADTMGCTEAAISRALRRRG